MFGWFKRKPKPNPAATADLIALKQAIELISLKMNPWLSGSVRPGTEELYKMERIKAYLEKQYKDAMAHPGTVYEEQGVY